MQFEQLDYFFENQLNGIPLSQLKQCIEDISNHYRENKFFIIKSKLYALAYALVRLPATGAALSYVLSQAPSSLFEKIENVIDLGSGPGTFLSLTSFFPELQALHLVEKNPHFISFLQELIKDEKGAHLHQKDFLSLDYQKMLSSKKPSAILASYSLGEIPANQHPFLERLFQSGADLLIFVEPGTPKGFQTLNGVRKFFLNSKTDTTYSIVAPCSHHDKCPLEGFGSEKWCHFPVRLQRTKYHRFLKGGTLGYEDEKISYLILSKENHVPIGKRILGKPRISKGSIDLELCIPQEVERLKLLPSNPDYKKGKKLSWGDLYF